MEKNMRKAKNNTKRKRKMSEKEYGELYSENLGKITTVLNQDKVFDEDILHDTFLKLNKQRGEIQAKRFVTYFVAWYKKLYDREEKRKNLYEYCGTNVADKYDRMDESDLAYREEIGQRVDEIIENYRTNVPKNAKNHARACEILQLYRDGLSEREIAEELCIGKSTVHQYIEVIIRQLRNKYGQSGV